MTLGFLAPAALALAALAAGPVLAHLARRHPQRVEPYGAMLLLRRMLLRRRHRRRLRDRLLLLLRVLAVLAAVLAVGRPEVRWPGVDTSQTPGAVVILIDNSLSMDLRVDGGVGGADGPTLLALARESAQRFVRGLPEGTRMGVITAGGQARRGTGRLTTDRSEVLSLIKGVRQTQGGTDLSGALGEARRLLDGGGLIAAFIDEAGPSAVEGARSELALLGEQRVTLQPHAVRAERVANVAVTSAKYGDGLEGGTVRVKLASFGGPEREVPVVVELPDGTAINTFVTVAGDEEAEAFVTVPRVTAGGVGTVRITDPALTADNTMPFHLPRVGASKVLVVDGDPGPTPVASEVYFLERALAPWGARATGQGGVLPVVTSSSGVGELDPDIHRVVFLANVADPAPLAAPLVDFVRRGGGLVVSLGDNVTPERYNSALAQLLPAALRKARALVARGEDGRATALPDLSLSFFQPFRRGGRASFGDIRWGRLFTLEPYEDGPQVRTLMHLDGGLPLLIERDVGRGRVLLLTSTLDIDWGNFPLQACFMPWVQRTVGYLGAEVGGGEQRLTLRTWEAARIQLPDATPEVTVTGPDGAVPAFVRSGLLTIQPERAGEYRVETPGAPPLARVAVTTDPAESDVRPGPSLLGVAAEIDPARFTRRLTLAPWALLAALLAALAQALLATVLARRDELAEQLPAEVILET